MQLLCPQKQNKCVEEKMVVEAFKTLCGWFSPKPCCGEETFPALQKFRLIDV